MQVTVSWMQAHFERFNKEYFGGELSSLPKFSVNNARTRLGTMSFRYRRKWGIRTCCEYTICLSNYYDMPEREFQTVLLHEMIHYYIAVKHIKDTSSHGRMFRGIMCRINNCGWNISVRTNTDGWPVAVRNVRENKKYTVLALVTVTGRCMLSVVNPAYVDVIDRAVRRSPDVVSHSWHTSYDSYFSTFSCVRTPRGRIVSRQEFDKRLAAMTAIQK